MGSNLSRVKNRPRGPPGRHLRPPCARNSDGLDDNASSKSNTIQARPRSGRIEAQRDDRWRESSGDRERKERGEASQPYDKERPPGRLRTVPAPGAIGHRQTQRSSIARPPPRKSNLSDSTGGPDSEVLVVESAPPSDLSESSASSPGFLRSNFVVANPGKLEDFYDVDTKTLGTGTYGSVARAVKKSSGAQRAVKAVGKSQPKSAERCRREIEIMKRLDHPNVVKLFETFEDHRNIYLVMELCEGGELFDRIIAEGYFTEKRAALLMRQVFSAVNYLHTNHIMHRDLKPENFLFLSRARDSELKVIDFGLSCPYVDGQYVHTKAGTPYYVAPQVLEGRYDFRCDAWSLGVILYILLCGFPPFYGDTDAEVLAKVRAGTFSFAGPEWKRVSDEGKDLIRKLLKINPDERLSVEHALHHPWIVSLAQSSQNVPLPVTLMGNLKGFRALNRLKKAALTVIAQNMTDADIEHLRKIFVSLDVDNSGTLSVQEVAEGLKRLGWSEIPQDLQAIMEEVDSDRSGQIDYTEFIAATMDRRLYIKEDVCWAAFRVFDLDGNGKISQDELRQVLGMPDVRGAVGSATIQALLNEVDLNGDGEIDFEEFMHMMRKRSPAEPSSRKDAKHL